LVYNLFDSKNFDVSVERFLMIGKTLAHYTILEKIGAGGMGEVYRARDLHLERDVALKFLPPASSQDTHSSRRFTREAKVLASLEHPNIASVYGLHVEDETQFIAMELVSGSTLEADIVDGGLSLDHIIEIGIPLAEAVAFAHKNGVIHRDLKPANVMRDDSGRLRVLDFGLAYLRQPAMDEGEGASLDTRTTPGEIVGTVAYMAPEQLEGRLVDGRADVFSIGIMLYELATGKRPFQAGSNAGVASAILRDTPGSIQAVRPDLPADFARLVRRCLEKSTARRLQTAQDICNELKDLQAGIRTGDSLAQSEASRTDGSITEHHMTITTEHIRKLSTRIPRMIGDVMTYLDNKVISDVLVLCLHGIGGDQRDFEEFLRQSPYRTIAVSLFGFSPVAAMRPPLSYADHNLLVTFLVQDLVKRIAPRTLILVGHSSGADQALNIAGLAGGDHIRMDGLILLGPAALPGEGLVSGPYSRLTTSPAEVLETVRKISEYPEDMRQWLIMHEYLVCAFNKFATNPEPLQHFAQTYIEDLNGDMFFELFRQAATRIKHVRCVYGKDEAAELNHALEKHLTENALGDNYSEEMFVTVSAGHIDLNSPKIVLPCLEEILRCVE
jgi:serine/threonine protein kinase